MKFCENCLEEIDTKDGENLCEKCERSNLSRNRRKSQRKARHLALESLGLIRVERALGGVYYE